MPDRYPDSRRFRFPASVKAVVAIAESTLAPHRFTYRILQEAGKAGLATFSMQHGFENVGLTYTDDVHAIEKVGFAAKHILIWGKMDSLHPACSRHTSERCIPVGCPTPTHQASPPELDTLRPVGQKIIGVFENLHWHRYTDCYREFFLDTVRHLAEKFDDYLFLVKPHHAGMWLTCRFKG
ncbi:MAG: hypothetical protein ACRD8U_03225, partial [Pyrinomonadaceae bacterium]